jgi:hypothetical protein
MDHFWLHRQDAGPGRDGRDRIDRPAGGDQQNGAAQGPRGALDAAAVPAFAGRARAVLLRVVRVRHHPAQLQPERPRHGLLRRQGQLLGRAA